MIACKKKEKENDFIDVKDMNLSNIFFLPLRSRTLPFVSSEEADVLNKKLNKQAFVYLLQCKWFFQCFALTGQIHKT